MKYAIVFHNPRWELRQLYPDGHAVPLCLVNTFDEVMREAANVTGAPVVLPLVTQP